MAGTQFTDELITRGTVDEPVVAANVGLKLALIMTIALSLLFIIWAIVETPGMNYSRSQIPANSAGVPSQLTPRTTYFNGRKITTNNDKSYADGQQVQSSPMEGSVPDPVQQPTSP